MKNFFKENFVLIAGLALPILLTLVFIMAANIRMPLKDPPKTQVIYAVNYYPGAYIFDINDKGELKFTYTPPDTARGEYCCPALPKLYVYNPITNTEEDLKLPEFSKDKKSSTIIEYSKKLSDNTVSPDGWNFEYSYDYNEGNVMTYMFGGGGHYGAQNVLKKDHYRVPVSKRPYENGTFIAWVIEE